MVRGDSCVIAIGVIVALAAASQSVGAPSEVTLADVVNFAAIGDPQTLRADYFDGPPALAYSPHGERVAVVVRHGNVERDTNDADLYIYRTADVLRNAPGKKLATFSSTINRPGIALVSWISDESLMFVGTQSPALSQVYEANAVTGKVTPLTHTTVPFDWVTWTPVGDHFVTFDRVADLPLDTRRECLERGCRVSDDRAWDGRLAAATSGKYSGSLPLSVFDRGNRPPLRIAAPEATDPEIDSCPMPRLMGGPSPDGHYGVRICNLKEGRWPDWWGGYTGDAKLKDQVSGKNGTVYRGYRLLITDLRKGVTRTLLESPYTEGEYLRRGSAERLIWIEGGRRLLLLGGYEPLDIAAEAERSRRGTTLEILEIDPTERTVTAVAPLPSNVRCDWAHWSQPSESLTVGFRDPETKLGFTVVYHRTGSHWSVTQIPRLNDPPDEDDSGEKLSPTIVRVEQSLNDPPKLVADDRGTGRRIVLLDPNPWLAERRLGHVEAISWKARNGYQFSGGLYYPSQYEPSRRYPLVIQTHGFTPGQFSMVGNVTNDNARALAAAGIAVLQMSDVLPARAAGDLPQVQMGYEGAIDYLDGLGLVDRDKVGIQGWSITGRYVAYTLTHSSYRFAATAFTSTSVGGFFYWMTNPVNQSTTEAALGSAPFGPDFANWERYDPDMQLERANSPTIMWNDAGSSGADGIEGLWDWYSALKRRNIPVEYWYFPDGSHSVYKVGQRLRASQLLVDWYKFWLKGEEVSGEEKTDQYRRWREMREQLRIVAPAHIGTP